MSRRIDEIAQMCAASSDAYSVGEWCEAANDLLVAYDQLRADLLELCDKIDALNHEAGPELDPYGTDEQDPRPPTLAPPKPSDALQSVLPARERDGAA